MEESEELQATAREEAEAQDGVTTEVEPIAAEEPVAGTPRDSRSADEGGFRHRHPDALRLTLAIGGIVVGASAILTFAGATSLVLFAGLPPVWDALVIAMGLAIPGLLAFFSLYLPRLEHRRYRYRVDETGLEIRHGIWWRSHRFIPRSRLQHTDVAQGPLERQFGLASLIVHTAGTHEAQTRLSGLSKETAYEVRGLLTETPDDGSDGV